MRPLSHLPFEVLPHGVRPKPLVLPVAFHPRPEGVLLPLLLFLPPGLLPLPRLPGGCELPRGLGLVRVVRGEAQTAPVAGAPLPAVLKAAGGMRLEEHLSEAGLVAVA